MRTTTDEDFLVARARKLRREGMSVPKIAKEVGVGRHRANKWVKHIPVPPAANTNNRKITEEMAAQAAEDWKSGKSLRRIAEELGVEHSTVSAAIKRHKERARASH